MKPRQPNSLSEALMQVYGALGMETVSEIIGKSETWAYNLADPDSDRWPTIRQCVALSTAYINRGFGECPIQAWTGREVAKRTADAPAEEPLMPLALLGKVIKECSEAEAELASIAAVDRMTPAQFRKLMTEISEAIQILQKTQRDIEARFAPKAVS